MFDEETFARDFDSFDVQPAGHVIQFDACTTGIGIWLRKRGPPGSVPPTVRQSIGAGGLSIRSWNVSGDSAYQNVAEFTGGVVGLIALIRSCVESREPLPKAVIFMGDSISALTWLEKIKHHGNLAFGASTLLNLIVTKYKIQIVGTEFIRGEDNTETDRMSRDTHSYLVFDTEPVRELCLGSNKFVVEALRLCDPTLVDEYIVAFETFWSDANQLVISLDPR
jgi:hypothetical protein